MRKEALIILSQNYNTFLLYNIRGMIEQFEDLSESHPIVDLTPEKIRQNLLESFKALSNNAPSALQLQRCHEVISKMMKTTQFFNITMKLLEEFQHSIQYANVAKLIITTLSTFLKHQQSTSRLVKKADRYSLNSRLIDVFTSNTIKQEVKLLLLKSYTQFIFAPGMETIRGQTVDLICNTFGLMTLHSKNEINTKFLIAEEEANSLMNYILVGRAFTKGPIQNSLMKSIIKTYLPSIQMLFLHYISRFSRAIAEKDEPSFMQISGICSNLIEFLKELVLSTSKDYLYLVKQSIMKDQSIRQIIYQALSLGINSIQGNNIQQLIIESNGNKYLDRINEIKQNCVLIVNHFAKACIVAQSNPKQLEKEEYQMPLEICRYYFENIPEIIIKQFNTLNYPQKDLPHSGLYKVLITTLANIVRINLFFDLSFKMRNKLFYTLCLPLLQRNPAEKFRNGSEFKGKRQDILNTHSMDIPQNAVCKLIESYVDRIDGSVIIFSSVLFQAVEFHLSANPNAYSKLPVELTESYFFKNADFLIQIQCCLTCFALFSYMSIGREDLIAMMENLFTTRKNFLFDQDHSGMFKSAVLLTYAYYVDNFYLNLKEGKSNNKEFHIQVLGTCCSNILAFSRNVQNYQERSNEYISLQVEALQSLDCLSNCITQKMFLQALFWKQEGSNTKIEDINFFSIFNFLINQLWGRLNTTIIDILIQFLQQSIKNQCSYGFARKRYHYQYKQVPLVIRVDICNIFCEHLYRFYNQVNLPHHTLMKNKIMKLLGILLTCCEFPDQFMSQQFFLLDVKSNDTWDISDPIDIFLRRMVVYRSQEREVNINILHSISITATNLLGLAIYEYNLHNLFGIFVNLMVLCPEIIDTLAPCLSKALISLLNEEDDRLNYHEELEVVIEKVAYLNLIAINDRFSPLTKDYWCFLTQKIQIFLNHRSTKGIMGAKSIPYIGKLLSISLVCIFNMKKILNFQETESSLNLWNSIFRTADIYCTTAERQIVSIIIIHLLDCKEKIEGLDEQCKKCFSLISHLLYKAYSKAIGGMKENYDENDDSSSSGLDSGEDLDEQSNQLNYRQYTIVANQFSKRQNKERYITSFKKLCHKLKTQSPEFLKNVVQSLPLPIKNFVKCQVFYYQPMGSQAQSVRRVIKVKKQTITGE